MAQDSGFGHVFVVRGNALTMAGDVLVVPTDLAGWVEEPWCGHLVAHGVAFEREAGVLGWLAPAGRQHIGGCVAVEPEGGRQLWLLPSGVSPPDRDASAGEEITARDRAALSEVLRQFADRLLAGEPVASRPVGGLGGRSCPLVVMPLLGSGQGGFGSRFRDHAAWLLAELREVACTARVDVVLVVYGHDVERAAAYEALLRQERRRRGMMPGVEQLSTRWVLGPSVAGPSRSVEEVLDGLVQRAAAGTVVPFFGAGVSTASGAPAWRTLLDVMGAEAQQGLERRGVDPDVVEGLDAYDRAQLYARVLGDQRLYALIGQQLGTVRPSLQHVLLAALRCRDAVTTNYDTAYERAVAEAGYGDVAVIPSSAARLRLLKVHGTVSVGQQPGSMLAPVLTREQLLDHQLLAGPLRGALQMMLLTGHVMFLGYGLGDAHLNEAINQVRRIREQARLARRSDLQHASEPAGGAPSDRRDTDEALATAIQVVADESLSLVWSPHVEVIWPDVGVEATSAAGAAHQDRTVASRDLEVLLDVLADAASLAVVPVLAFDDIELQGSDDEKELRKLLERLRAHFGDDQPLPVPVASLLAAYGARDLPGG